MGTHPQKFEPVGLDFLTLLEKIISFEQSQ